MSPRPLIAVACLLALAGCADPPGMKKPLPLDVQEQGQAQDIYRRFGPEVARYPGVVGTYLTQSNNPRRIVVICRDEATRDAIKKLYGRSRDGLRIRYEITEKGWEPEDEMEAVPTENLPQTWWDKFVFYMKNFAMRVLPSDVIDEGDDPAAPKLPPPKVDDKNLKAT